MVLIKTFAEALTKAQIWAAVSTAILLLQLFIKFIKEFKTVKENLLWFWMQCKSSLAWAKKKFWQKNIAEQLAKISGALEMVMKEQLRVSQELMHNGGSSMKDAVRRLEQGQAQILKDLNEKGQIRKAMQKFSDTMTFHMNAMEAWTFVNDALLKFFGCSENDLLVDAYENMIHDEDVPGLRNKQNRAVSNRTPFRHELRMKNKATGKYYTVLMKADPIVIDEQLKYFYGTIEIINE